MCGITFFINNTVDDVVNTRDAMEATSKIAHRGPDRSRVERVGPGMHMGFSRLCINDLSRYGDQPFTHEQTVMVCNGEIYNHKQLQQKYKIKCRSGSDCEVILHLYALFKDVRKFVDELDGVFAFVLYDRSNQTVHVARDMIGIRPLFWTGNCTKPIAFASEAKGLLFHPIAETQTCVQFPPGHCLRLALSKNTEKTLLHPFTTRLQTLGISVPIQNPEASASYRNKAIRNLLHSAVRKRLMSCRSIGCLLSGGLDSSLVTSIVVREMGKMGVKPCEIHTYSIGMPGSVDLHNAKIVSRFLGTVHHEVMLSEEDFLNAIPETIWHIESPDVTSVRASVGNFLVSKYIAKNTEDKVIFNGDVADELFASYLGFCRAPNPKSLRQENIKMLLNIHYFDVLRSDRSISGAGLEARTPFADKAFMKYVMSLHPNLKQFDSEPHGRMEKHVLRTAFMDGGYLPASILWRKKEAFSDGVSSTRRSWHKIAQKRAQAERARITGDAFPRDPDWTDEQWWYNRLFTDRFGHKFIQQAIPFRWKHPFAGAEDNEDPSARQIVCETKAA